MILEEPDENREIFSANDVEEEEQYEKCKEQL